VSSPPIELIQRLLDGPYRGIERNRAALQEGRWQSRLQARHQPPPWHRPWARREHRRCFDVALEHTDSEPTEVVVDVIPLWWGDIEDGEGPDARWFIAHGIRADDGPLAPLELGPLHHDATLSVERRLWVRARRWNVGQVVKVRSYAPGIELLFRGETLGVLAGEILEVIGAEPKPGAPLPRPRIPVPSFCCWYEPRVDALDDEEVDVIRAMSITVDDEGNLIDRPPSG
jgi:hypothetical protein